MKDKVDTTWVPEEMAAEMLGLEARTLRKKIKQPDFLFSTIKWRNTNGRNWQYTRKSIMEFKLKTSSESWSKIA